MIFKHCELQKSIVFLKETMILQEFKTYLITSELEWPNLNSHVKILENLEPTTLIDCELMALFTLRNDTWFDVWDIGLRVPKVD